MSATTLLIASVQWAVCSLSLLKKSRTAAEIGSQNTKNV
jgi:hypothetical protein